MSNSWFKSLVLAFAASPAVLPLYVILANGINFPFWDQWDPGISGMFIKAHEGTLHFSDLFAQHNEHRILVPKLIYLALGTLTHWNTRIEMIAGWVMACGTSGAVLWLSLKGDRQSSQAKGSVIAIWFLCNICIFSMSQWENWLGGVGMVNVMGGTLLVLTVACATIPRSMVVRVCSAMILAAAATFTSGSGILCWPLGGIVLAWSATRDELWSKRWYLLIWLLGFILTALLFFYGYQRLPSEPSKNEGFLGVISYFLIFLGATYGPAMAWEWPNTSLLIGTCLFALYAVSLGYFLYLWRSRKEFATATKMLIWLVIGAYTILNGCLAAIMRFQFGSSQASSSRYATFSMFLSVALINLIPEICRDLRREPVKSKAAERLWFQVPGMGAALVVWLHFSTTVALIPFVTTSLAPRRAMKAAVLLADALPGNAWLRPPGFPAYPGMEDRARALSKMGYLQPGMLTTNNAQLIRAPESSSEGDGDKWGSIEQVQLSPDQRNILVRGWAISSDLEGPAHAVIVTIENARKEPIMIGFNAVNERREDVASKKGNSAYLNSGWTITCAMPALQGLREIRLAAWSLNTETGQTYELAGHGLLNR